MAQFVPQASSPELHYCKILGPIWVIAKTFSQHLSKVCEAALFTEIWTSDTPAGLFVYDEIAFRKEELRNMVVEIWLHPDDIDAVQPFLPGAHLPPQGSEGSASYTLYAPDWHSIGYGATSSLATSPALPTHAARCRAQNAAQAGAGMDHVMVPIETAAATLLDYFVTIVAANPLSHGDDFTHIPLATFDVHMMDLIIRTQLAYNQLRSSDFSINFWRRALHDLAHGGHLPRSEVHHYRMDEQEFLNAVYYIVASNPFPSWAAAADYHFKHEHEHDLPTFFHEWRRYSQAIALFVAQYIPHRISTHRNQLQLPAPPAHPHDGSGHHAGTY